MRGEWLVLPRVYSNKLYYLFLYSINSLYGADGRPMIRKTPSVTGRHNRPVRLQNAWLFSCGVSFCKNGWSKEPVQAIFETENGQDLIERIITFANRYAPLQ